MDIETTLYFWSFILALAALVLFVEAVALIRYFLMHRRPRRQCLLALLPLSVSIWAFIAISQTPPFLDDNPGGPHFTYAMYLALRAPYILGAAYDQRLLVICAVVFFITLVIERILHVRYSASSQYHANARSISQLIRDTETPLQATARQSWELQLRGRR